MTTHAPTGAGKTLRDLLPAPKQIRFLAPVTASRPLGDSTDAECGRMAEDTPGSGGPAPAKQCYADIIAPTKGAVPKIGFEFDLSYGASTIAPPIEPGDPGYGASVWSLIGKNVTTHRIKSDGFRLEGDGNRIEIGTKPFEVSKAGHAELRQVMKDVLDLARDLRQRCAAVQVAKGPRYFTPPYLEAGVACVVPLAFSRKTSYFAAGCTVGAAPQATFDFPLSRVDELVNSIRASEKDTVAGRALSGPAGARQGVRSVALYDAQRAVNASRAAHLKAGTRLSDGNRVTELSFSKTLQGLLILLVSYLRTSLLTYSSSDYEQFAKAYLPLNVKNPFRLLFADLTAAEHRTFTDLYDTPRERLWRLAKPGATASDGDNTLFPPITHGHQGAWFDPLPTWSDLIEKSVSNTPLLRTKHVSGMDKKGEDLGCEVLFAPLSRILPHEPGSRRVTVEMRRLGHNWVFSHGAEIDGVERPSWGEMVETLFELAARLNR